ncbi:hypothetical protein [Streptomyces paromomycinus]|uniref:Protein kilB n=1 Tax=Streptomyces paromomycinus TaxID=92743 RepID=A0A401W4C8_STREY|nr:hypothetical protein [Streptomyces paromomycinus]GCD44152.1 hypothetical protein GKJPGBOP_03843 [Streptomyces paromomycinus]
MESTITSVIAVLGTLGGALVAGVLHSRSAARSEQVALRERLRREQQDAALALIKAVKAHRRNCFTRWKLRTLRASCEAQEAARFESWDTRSDVTDAQDALHLITDNAELLRRADAVVGASLALSEVDDTTTQADMDTRGDAARAAHAAFVAAAARCINGV